MVWALVALLAVSGCATYRPMPITPGRVHGGLNPPDMNEVRLRARGIKHPLLKPVLFNDRDGLSPDEAAILAIIANPALRAVRDQRGIAAAQLLQAGILPNPQLSLDLEIPVGGDIQGKINGLGLGLGWEITALISRSARLDGARAQVSSVDLAVAWQEWQVAEAARLQAYRVISAGKRLLVAEQARISWQRLCKDMKQGLALGVKTRPDLLAAETGRQQAESQVLAARAAMDQQRLALNRALGLPAAGMIPLEKDVVPRLPQCPSVETLFEDAKAGRLDLLGLKLGYESQEARVRAAIRSRFPKINLGLTNSRDTDGIQSLGPGLGIDLPFFDRNQGHIAKERATRRQLFDEYIARLFETRADIARLVTAIKATRHRIAAIDESLVILEALIKNYQHAADTGQDEIFPYYDTVNSLYNKQIQRIELEQGMVDLGIALEVAVGRYGLVSETGPGPQAHRPTPGMEALK